MEECLQILKTCSWVYVDVMMTVCSDYYICIAFLHFLLPLTSPPLPSNPFSHPLPSPHRVLPLIERELVGRCEGACEGGRPFLKMWVRICESRA